MVVREAGGLAFSTLFKVYSFRNIVLIDLYYRFTGLFPSSAVYVILSCNILFLVFLFASLHPLEECVLGEDENEFCNLARISFQVVFIARY